MSTPSVRAIFKLSKITSLVSFSGSLAPGIITMGVLQAVLLDGLMGGIMFSLGAVLVEGILVWLTLYGLNWFYNQKKAFRFLETISFIILLLLTIGAAVKAFNPTSNTTILVLPAGVPCFFSGVFLRLITPTFVPFWMGWSVALLSTKVLTPGVLMRTVYAISASLGTFAAHILFAALSYWASESISQVQSASSWIILAVLVVSLALMGYKLLYPKRPHKVLTT